jgi:hypothetical protein
MWGVFLERNNSGLQIYFLKSCLSNLAKIYSNVFLRLE